MKSILVSLTVLFSLQACTGTAQPATKPVISTAEKDTRADLSQYSKAYFASGCFWCVEAIYESVNGVKEAVSGYAGGTEPNPTYELVSTGRTRYAECIEVYYDSTVVSYEQLLKVFYDSHDPTIKNGQGPDNGPQYRSMIFYQNEHEKTLANAYIQKLLDTKAYPFITTEVAPFKKFYPAEGYHQDFEHNNPDNSYIQGISVPRLNKFKEKAPQLLKGE
jgi:peptide-methionine (S)-S-oxide reductase